VAVNRVLPSQDAHDLVRLTRELADKELRPKAAEYEERHEFPRELFRTLGRSGLLGLPYPEEYGGGGQPYEVYLHVLEELAHAWLAVALGVSVHGLACHATAMFGSPEQKARYLPDLLGGELLGAYCLSEPESGSDAASLRTRAERDPDGRAYTLTGTKAWVSHDGVADFYTVMARTGGDGAKGISTFLVPADTPGVCPQQPEQKMGLYASPTGQVVLNGVRVLADRRIGAEGDGFTIAMSALDGGRLGIAACAVGVAQAALDHAVDYARERRQFGHPIIEFQGVGFLLADMATQVAAARALYLEAARLRDAGLPYSDRAAMAKLFSTDTAMRVTTDAVQVLGGAGYVEDHPVERYFREAKVLEIVEGTNQVQRLVISRTLRRR
jgi:alkylation response protein AidB-like acyl-CoA dehydrogenase